MDEDLILPVLGRRHFPLLSPSGYDYPKHPLTAVAERSPTLALEAMRSIQAMSTFRSLSSDHTQIACTWLQNRYSGERNILIDTPCHEDRGFFSAPRRARVSTRVSIW